MQTQRSEKIILGIDPGTLLTGFGVIEITGRTIKVLGYGTISMKDLTDPHLKLKRIFAQVTELIDLYLPDEIALEAPFFGKNVQSMLKLGRAQGVAISAALARDIPVMEYAPKKVKQAVTSNGNASKQQVAAMLEQLLNIEFKESISEDATDALGVALCHHYLQGSNKRQSKSWSSFAKANPNRIIG